MPRNSLITILGLFGITDMSVANQMIDAATNRGKYEAILLNNPSLGGCRTITIHHGMKGNVTHYWTLEIK